MPAKTSAAAQALGRLLLSLLFVITGFGFFSRQGDITANIAAHHLPFPELGYVVALATEFGGGLLILLGFQTRLAALALATFCVITGVVFHYDPGNAAQMGQYYKDLALAGGFLQLFAVGGGAWSLDAFVGRRKI
jgi:putative oxidoreductase